MIGAGPVGENVADRVRRGRLSVAVVESELVGDEYSYWACAPSKALLRPPAAVAAARAVDGARQAVTGELAAEAVLARRTMFTGGWVDDSGQVAWLGRAGINLIRGRGRLVGDRKAEVDDREGRTATLAARPAVVMATGSTAAITPVPGLAEPLVWTSREATSEGPQPLLLNDDAGETVTTTPRPQWRGDHRARRLPAGRPLLDRNQGEVK